MPILRVAQKNGQKLEWQEQSYLNLILPNDTSCGWELIGSRQHWYLSCLMLIDFL